MTLRATTNFLSPHWPGKAKLSAAVHNHFFRCFSENEMPAKGGGSHPIQNFSNQKLSVFFFGKGGGGLSQSKISLSEKTEIFVGFFLPKGGGSHLFQEGFYHKILIFVIKYSVFF